MNQQDQKIMETLLDLFNHEGWKIFIEDQELIQKNLKDNAYVVCNTNDEWQQHRGALVTLDRILTFEQTTKYVVENQDESDEL